MQNMWYINENATIKNITFYANFKNYKRKLQKKKIEIIQILTVVMGQKKEDAEPESQKFHYK